jgi:hypothetical protein
MYRMTRVLAAGLFTGVFFMEGCLDTDIAKRFREAYAPGFTSGLGTALEQPGQAETGLRQMGVALADGLGAILQPRTSASSSSSSGSSSSSTRN